MGVALKIKSVVGYGVRANLLKASQTMPLFQGQSSMRLDVSAELLMGDGGQCVRLGGRNVDLVVTPSLSLAVVQ
jgi:hypothetical protein